MLLACDIGNSNIKSALFNNDILSEFKVFRSIPDFIEYAGTVEPGVTAVSSVVPTRTKELKDKLNSSISFFEITSASDFNIKINYNPVNSLGTDRACSCEGAISLLKKSREYNNFKEGDYILTVDFGTATTINFLTYPDSFIGGIIAPGITLMKHSLNTGTAQLPQADLTGYNSLIGKDTVGSITSGIINSAAGLLERSIQYVARELKSDVFKIFITGGNAEILMPHLHFEYTYEKALVLYGIESVYRKAIKKE